MNEYNKAVRIQIGERIRLKRKERRLTDAEVAAELNISTKQLSRIENGESSCKMEQLYVLKQLLKCSADYLLFGDTIMILDEEQQAAIDNLLSLFR